MTHAEKMQLARHPATSAETLAGLATDPDDDVRRAVALHAALKAGES